MPHAPCLSDIAQYGIGDCYLLSAVSSILQKNPDAIRDMMVDRGSTAVVRLYVGTTAHYYEVSKVSAQQKPGGAAVKDHAAPAASYGTRRSSENDVEGRS